MPPIEATFQMSHPSVSSTASPPFAHPIAASGGLTTLWSSSALMKVVGTAS